MEKVSATQENSRAIIEFLCDGKKYETKLAFHGKINFRTVRAEINCRNPMLSSPNSTLRRARTHNTIKA